jgi:glycogen/starch synthases, ADP-glucose type
VPFKVLSVASEAVPLIKTGGLADVVGALPSALAPHDVEVTTLLPGYRKVVRALGRTRVVHAWESLLGTPARLLSGKLVGGHPLLVLDAPALFDRDGAPYADAAGRDWTDNWRRFAALGRAAADVAGGAVVRRGTPAHFDLLHAHDWQAALAAAYVRYAPHSSGLNPKRRLPSVVTIHNMAFQGWFDGGIFPRLGLPRESWSLDGVEYHGGVSLLKAGLTSADAITTVSPSYAREIRSATFGMGLEGVIAARGNAVYGILNGIDSDAWNPATDAALASRFGHRTLARRLPNKRALETEFGLQPDDGPIFIVVSRLTWQKGMDVLLEVIDHLVGLGGRLALLGSGDAGLEEELLAAAQRHPGRVGIRIGYDEDLSHRMQAGGDAILVPSRFEPCGLTQLYGLAYGCVPVVSRTGGLADTVIDANPAAMASGCATGVQFGGVSYEPLAAAITRTIWLYSQPDHWERIQKNGMKCDFSWKVSGKAYADLYRSLAG